MKIEVTYVPSETRFWKTKADYFNGWELIPKVPVSTEAPF